MARRTEGGMERVTLGPQARAPLPPSQAADAPAAAVATGLQPATVAEAADAVRDAAAHGSPLRLIGRGTWLAAGRPVVDARPLSLDRLSGIIDYTPGDLTLTARAGTPLREIAAATDAEGQWLPLAPWGGDSGSLGATVATATAGPLSGAFGTPRDIVLGLEAITGNGDVIRAGGRVVKNVAGFDLTRLMVGAWGTLGAITEVSVRLRSMPERETTLALPLPDAAPVVAELLARLRAASIEPIALELVTAGLAARLGLNAEASLLVYLAGNEASVAAQRDALAELGETADVSADVWRALRMTEPADASVVRMSSTVARFAETWTAAVRLAAAVDGGVAHASVMRSVARVVLPNDNGALPRAAEVAIRQLPRAGSIFERLPAALWAGVTPSAADDRLSRRLRDMFDPRRVLNPGILGAGVA